MTQMTLTAAVIGFSPIERAGLELLLLDNGATTVTCYGCAEEPVAGPADVVLLDLTTGDGLPACTTDVAGTVTAIRARLGASRVVGVADDVEGSAPSADRLGLDAIVSRTSRPEALLGALVDQHPPRRPWRAPTIAALPLSAREREVLERIAGGCTSKVIAASLGISAHTVESHKQRLFRRLGVQNQAQAVAAAVRLGLLEPGQARSAS